MPTVLLVPDLPLERWASMDRYAHRLHDWLESGEFGFHVRLAAHIGALTRDSVGRRTGADKRDSRGTAFVRWWTQPVDPSRVVLPGPLHGPQQWAARYYFYPWRVKREAKRVDLVHVLDHSYAHMIETAGRRPVVVTVHDLMPVVVLRSPTDGWREGVRNRFLRQALKALRQADAYIVGTDWLKHELATWLGNDKNIHVVPFGVDRAFFSETTPQGARERWRHDWRIPEDAFVVLHVGSTVDRKNVPLVIQTIARLRHQTDAYLLQVGGRFTQEQEQLIDRLGLRGAVRSVAAADETTLRRAYPMADGVPFPPPPGGRSAAWLRRTSRRCGAPPAWPTCCCSRRSMKASAFRCSRRSRRACRSSRRARAGSRKSRAARRGGARAETPGVMCRGWGGLMTRRSARI